MKDGNYYGTIKTFNVGKASTGTPQIAVTFAVTHEAAGAEWRQIEQIDRTVYLYLSDAAYAHTEKKLESLNFNFDWNNPAFPPDTAATLCCRTENYQGKAREKWDLPAGNGGGDVEPLSADDIRRLASKRAKANTPPRGRPTPPPAKPSAPPAEPTDSAPVAGDDIPF